MTENIIVALISSIGGGLIAVAGMWLKDKRQAKHQNSDVKLRRIVQLETRVDRLEAARRTDQDYIETLREHIRAGKPPPPPPYPAYAL